MRGSTTAAPRRAGRYQFLVSPTFNNLLGQHEQFNVAYAGVTQIDELQFVALAWRQVLTSEGLGVFANASYSWGRPGTQALRTPRLPDREHGRRGRLLRSVHPLPRSQRDADRPSRSSSDNYSHTNLDFFNPFQVDRLRGARSRVDADVADKLNGINQFSVTVSRGLDGLGSTSNGNPVGQPAGRTGRFHQDRGGRAAGCRPWSGHFPP